MALATVSTERIEEPVEPLAVLHCSGCGRRIGEYTPEPIRPGKMMRFRCRCKTWTELHGNQAVAALRAVTQEDAP